MSYTGTPGNDSHAPISVGEGDVFDGLGGQDTLDLTGYISPFIIDLENNLIEPPSATYTATILNFEEILAGSGADILWGGSAPVLYDLNGGDGNDTIGPGLAGIVTGDVFDGGLGINTLDLSRGQDPYIVDLNAGTVTQGRSIATIANFRNVVGSDEDDTITARNGANPFELNAGGGDDIFIANPSGVFVGQVYNGFTGTDRLDFSNYGSGYTVNMNDDTFTFSANTAFFATILSIEDVRAGHANDTIIGDGSSETFRGGGGSDRLVGNQGRDLLAGNDGEDTLLGGDHDDELFGGNDNDTLSGGDGEDTANGGNGDDLIFGNNDDDHLDGGNDQDEISGGNGEDMVFGRAGEDTLRGGNQNDRLYGGSESDTVAGNAGNDSLEGGSGDDALFGGSGADTLIGGAGADQLSGGSNADVFLFREISDSPHSGPRDTITDFVHNVDMIDLSGIAGGLSFVAAYTGSVGEVRYNDAIGRLYIDIDGDQASDFSIDITGAPTIDAGDLIL